MVGENPPLGQRFDDALRLASELHRWQVRKGGSNIPYLAHLLAVCSLVLEYGGSEDEAIAALLHDGPEDQGGEETLWVIREMFGDTVADIVAECSDTFETPKPPWLGRKQAYLARLDREDTPLGALLVSAADKLHNLRSTIADLGLVGDTLWERFTGTPGQQLWYYRSLAEIYQRRLPGPLADAVAGEVATLARLVGSDRSFTGP